MDEGPRERERENTAKRSNFDSAHTRAEADGMRCTDHCCRGEENRWQGKGW